jgi:hypothetical protein
MLVSLALPITTVVMTAKRQQQWPRHVRLTRRGQAVRPVIA